MSKKDLMSVPAVVDPAGFEAGDELSKAEIEIRLAIAEYVIKRVNGTPEGQAIFEALISRFDNRYPQHKLLAHCLMSPGYIDSECLYND